MTWILLRGLTREARHWGEFPRRLEPFVQTPAAGAPQILTLDLPGNGAFYRELSPCAVRPMVEFARQQLRASGNGPPYRLMAMSLGGMVAADWAQQYPREVSRLVLINTSLRPFSGVTERLRPGNWMRLALLAARWQGGESPDYVEQAIHQLTCQCIASRDADLAAWVRIRKEAPVSLANAGRQLWAAARFSGPKVPGCPVLVLSSQGDQLVHSRCSARLAEAWNAAHHEHPWAGHDLPHDDPAWVGQRVAEWLRAQDPLRTDALTAALRRL
ncbi:alpha/beta fold hydrolase [Polaromonas sp.]|uniref:alpha/beta fold hydrolase n=1 Tax=Polaromonas sp. TaxID=1869339 RepID=UPI001A31DB08|nr:alpha/beta fold hydrolase [Xanthomonadaceae bacterium]